MTTHKLNRFIDALNAKDREDAARELFQPAQATGNSDIIEFINKQMNPLKPEIHVRHVLSHRDDEGELISSDFHEDSIPADELLTLLKTDYDRCSCSHINPASWWYQLTSNPDGTYKERSIHLLHLDEAEWNFLADYLPGQK